MYILILTFTAVYTMHITNLSPIQRIAVTEKYRPIYERQAKENLKLAEGGDRRSEKFEQNQGLPNLVKVENRIDTTKN